jgi:hypothetical protein
MKRRVTEYITAAQLLILVGCLSTASGESIGTPCAEVTGPSALDYVVLAGMADSPYPLGMSGYDSAKRGGAP